MYGLNASALSGSGNDWDPSEHRGGGYRSNGDRRRRFGAGLKRRAQWRPTPALRRCLLVIGIAMLSAIILGRIDLLVFALPFAVGAAVALNQRPHEVPQVRQVDQDTATLVEGGHIATTVEIPNEGPSDLVARIRVNPSRWLRLESGDGWLVRKVGARQTATVHLAATALRWGTHQLGPTHLEMVAGDGMLVADPTRVPELNLRVYPSATLFDSDQPLVRAAGLSGAHHARRLGEGGELAEVRQFQSGDRLRRIDWRVSLRQRQLHVDATFSERDADIVVLIDALHDVGQVGGVTSLDLSVRAAAAIARHYTRQGDRVAIAEMGPRQHHLRGGTGRRQYLLILEWLTKLKATGGSDLSVDRLLRTGFIPGEATVVILTPLLSDSSTTALAKLARSGRPLVAVDVLPGNAGPQRQREWTDLAWRLWWLQRVNTADRLRALGVPMQRWSGPGSLDELLRQVAVLDRAAKVVKR